MKKLTFILASLCLSATMFAQNTTQKVMINGKPSAFEARIQVRETIDPTAEHKQPTAEERFAQWDQQREAIKAENANGLFKVGKKQLMAMAKSGRAGHVKERMDSVIVREGNRDANGKPISLQEFTYTDDGKPLTCINSVADDATGQWKYYGEYGYEYDDLSRMTAYWVINGLTHGETERYEFVYNDDTPYYSAMIYYTYDNSEWMPSQMVEYTFDANYNTTEEVYSAYDADAGDWVYAQRVTASYDEQNHMTSHYNYLWDAAKADWVGNTNANPQGEAWEYTATGADAQYTIYQWTDNGWQGKTQTAYTYDEQGKLSQIEWFAWQTETESWLPTSKTVYTYDEQGREIRYDSYNAQADGTYGTFYTYTTTEYDTAENGDDITILSTYGNIGGTDMEMYRRTTTHHKHDRSLATAETYYLNERRLQSGGPIIKMQESFRFIDDEGHYLGLEDYSFTPNETNFRQGSSKEEVTYDENWRQTGNHHWRGRRTGATTWQWDDYDDWVVYPVDTYDGWVAAGYDLYTYSGTNKVVDYGFYSDLDAFFLPENMVKWISTANNESFRKYKYLQTYNYKNTATDGSTSLYEYTNYYYYTQLSNDEGGWPEDGSPITLSTKSAENMKAVQAANGEIYVAWAGYDYDINGYAAYAQLVDTDGYNIFGSEGMLINTKATSGTSSTVAMATDTDNNLIAAFPDARNYESQWNTNTFAYKFGNDNGTPLWAAEGIQLPADNDNSIPGDIIYLNGNAFVTFTNSNDYSDHFFYINRLDADGSLAWEESKQLPGSFPAVVPSGDNLMVVYCQDKKVYAQLFNADLEPMWDEPMLANAEVEISSLPYTGSLFNALSDGNGGLVASFLTASYNGKSYVMHVSADGTAAMTALNPDGEAVDGLKIAVNGDEQQVATFYQSGDWSGHTLNMQVVGFDGTAVKEETTIVPDLSSYTITDVKDVDGNYVVAYINAINYSEANPYIIRIDKETGIVYGEQVGSGASAYAHAAIFDDEAAYYFWLMTETDYETYTSTYEIQGVRRFYSDINTKLGEEETTAIKNVNTTANTLQPAVIYDVQGRQQSSMVRGLNIVRSTDGTTKKIIRR